MTMVAFDCDGPMWNPCFGSWALSASGFALQALGPGQLPLQTLSAQTWMRQFLVRRIEWSPGAFSIFSLRAAGAGLHGDGAEASG